MNIFIFHFRNKALKIRKSLFIYGKVLIPFHIVYIEIYAVYWKMILLILFNHLSDLIGGIIAPSALTVAECPLWRHIALPDKFSELPDYRNFCIAIYQIKVIIRVFEGYLKLGGMCEPNIKGHYSGGIYEDTEKLRP